MKRCSRYSSGESISEIFGTIIQFGFVLLTLWGIGWSFYRHGAVHGVAAVLVPPYAWYRGVASVWDKPRWKEDFEVRTEQLALVIENAVNSDPTYQVQSREYIRDLKEWAKSLPASERSRVHEASRNYALAMGTYIQRYLSDIMAGKPNPQPELDATVQQRVERFRSVAGFANRWQEFVRDSSIGLKSVADEASDNGVRDSSSLTVADRAIAQNRMHTYLDGMTAKMEGLINDVFPE
jgi:hypothetical protein